MKTIKNVSLMKNVQYIILSALLMVCGNVMGETVTTDVLTISDISSSATNQTYADFTATKTAASYSGQTAKDHDAIQIRSKNGTSGIVSTTSGGKIKSVSVTWEANTASERTLNVYGSHSALTISDLYSGNSVGTIVYGTSTEYVFTSDYEYVGVRSSDGAMYLTNISFTWTDGQACQKSIELSKGTPQNGTFTITEPLGEYCVDGGALMVHITDITPINSNYMATAITATNGTPSDIVNGEGTVYNITDDTEINVTFSPKTAAALYLSALGNKSNTPKVTGLVGDTYTFTSGDVPSQERTGHVFYGWSDKEFSESEYSTTEPTIYRAGDTYTLKSNNDVLYAVYAVREGTAVISWSDFTSDNTMSECTFVIAANVNGTYYAMKNNFGAQKYNAYETVSLTDGHLLTNQVADYAVTFEKTSYGATYKIKSNSLASNQYLHGKASDTDLGKGTATDNYNMWQVSTGTNGTYNIANYNLNSQSQLVSNDNRRLICSTTNTRFADYASSNGTSQFDCEIIPVGTGYNYSGFATRFITYSDFAYKCTYDINYENLSDNPWAQDYVAPSSYDHNLHGAPVALPTGDNLADGQYFRGWYDNVELTGDPITSLAVTGNGDKTVYAAWANVVNFYVQGAIAKTQAIDADNHVTGYTPTATCTGKKFMGWSTINQTELIQDPASLDLFTDFSDKVFSSSTDLYAVYAAYNGGKPSEAEYYKTNYFNEEERSFWNLSENASFSSSNVYSADGAVRLKMPKNSTDEVYITTKEKIENLSKISFWIKKTGGSNNKFFAQFSTDGTEWTEMNIANKPTGADFIYTKVEAVMPSVQSAYVRIVAQPDGYSSDYDFFVDDVTFYYKPAQYWYSDYSTTCTMAESAKLSYDSPDGESEYSVKANPVGKTITISDPKFAGYTLDYVEIKGQQYNVGDSYILAHDVTGTAHWTLAPVNVDKSDIYVTSTNGVTVQAHDVVTASNSNLTDTELGSLVATSNNAAFAVEVTNGTLSSDYGLQDATITITYTPTAYNITETATISLKLSNDGTGAEPRGTFTVYGRSLPQNFVIAMQTKDAEEHDIWVALPANMFSAGVYEGETIELDNKGNALASIQYQYSITGRWETMSADAVRIFSNANNDKRCLYASKSTTNIEDYAKLTSSGPTANNYAWLLETTDLTNYKFKNLGRESNQYLKYSTTGKFGMYASGNEDFQIFPVEVITELGLRIVEWGTDNHVLVSYDYDGVTKDMNILVKVGTPAERAINLSNSRIGSSDLYNLDCSTLFNFGESAGKTIRFKATESTITKEISYTVPFIVTDDVTTAALTTDAEMTGTPVVITPGATLTVDKDAAVNNFNEVMIYPAANLHVPSGTTLATSKLTLRSGYDGLNGELFDLPQAFVEGAITQQPIENEDGEVTTPTEPMEIHYQYNIDNAVFYDLAVPYAADIYTITDETGFADFSMWVENYDGEKRVSDGKGWVDYNEWGDDHAPLHVGTGYLAAVKPINNRPHFMLDIPMSADLSGGEPAKGEFNVTAPGFTDGTMNNGLHANNVGWNFVANPYMTAFSTSETDALNGSLTFQTGELVQEIVDGNWTGHYVYKETTKDVRYVTTYDGEHYVQHPMSETKLMPFTGFFVQVSTAGQLNFNLGSRALAPAPAMIEETTLPKETELIFTLKSEKEEDNLVLLLGNAFSRTNAYEFMNDQSKVFTGSGLKFYTMENTEELYANAMQYDEAQYIPVGVRVDAAGEYTFDRFDNDKWDNVESCLIIDTKENNFIDLMKQPYTTQLEKGTNNDRFMLHLVMKTPSAPTSIFGTDDGGGGPQKIIHNSLMYIIMPDGRVYNAAGDQVNGKEVLK